MSHIGADIDPIGLCGRGWAAGGAAAARTRTTFALRGGGPAAGRYRVMSRCQYSSPSTAISARVRSFQCPSPR